MRVSIQAQARSHITSRTGYYFAALNAIISGFAIYINSFGVKLFADSTLYTTLKNAIVGLALLVPFAVIASRRHELATLSRRQWGYLLLLALVGGSVPYALFFRGLQLTTSTTSSLINHTQFVVVALLAIFFLRERVGPLLWLALLALLIGTTLGTNIHALRWNEGAWLIGFSTIFFAVGVVLAKHLLREISLLTVMMAKMSIGSVLLLAYVAINGRLSAVTRLSLIQWEFVIATGLILLAFTVTAFLALRYASATAATAIPAAAPIITASLVMLSTQHIRFLPLDGIGLGLTALSAIAVAVFAWRQEASTWNRHQQPASA